MDRLSGADFSELEALCSGGVVRGAKLSEISQWRIGGLADIMLCPASTAEVAAIQRWFATRGIRPVVIGHTSNLLFDDEGLRVPCIHVGARLSEVIFHDATVKAQAGVWVPFLARRIMLAGLSGAEHICGIPGTLGGLICMNGGSQRKGIGSSLLWVESVDAEGVIHRRTGEDCGFGYRRSKFQTNGEIITSARLRMLVRPTDQIRSEMRRILKDRRVKFPRKEPNCGSVFKSNPEMYSEIGPPGAVIERLGFKGLRVGGAQVSTRHANFIVNNGGATARDVLSLISCIVESVEALTGYRMESEVRYVHSTGDILPADLVELGRAYE